MSRSDVSGDQKTEKVAALRAAAGR